VSIMGHWRVWGGIPKPKSGIHRRLYAALRVGPSIGSLAGSSRPKIRAVLGNRPLTGLLAKSYELP